MPKIIKTEQYAEDLEKIYRYTYKTFGLQTARKTKQQIDQAERQLSKGTAPSKFDPKHHSPRFHFISIRNSQKIFFEPYKDRIYLVTAGHDRRNWKIILADLEDYADQQIAKLAE